MCKIRDPGAGGGVQGGEEKPLSGLKFRFPVGTECGSAEVTLHTIAPASEDRHSHLEMGRLLYWMRATPSTMNEATLDWCPPLLRPYSQ